MQHPSRRILLFALVWLALAVPAASQHGDHRRGGPVKPLEAKPYPIELTAEERRLIESRFPSSYEQASRKLGQVLAGLEGALDERGDPLGAEEKQRRGVLAVKGVEMTMRIGSQFVQVEQSPIPRHEKARKLADLKGQMKGAEDLLGADHVPFMLEDGGLGKIMVSVESSVHHWKRMMDRNPRNFDAFLGGGKEYLKANQPAQAVEALERAIELDPGSADALAARGAARLRLGQTRAAYEDALAALRIDPRNAGAFSLKKLSEGRGIRPPKVKIEIDGASEDGGAVGNGASQTSLFPQLPPGAAQSARLAREAESAYRLRDFPAAERLADKALTAYPQNPQAYYVKASMGLLNKRYKDAADDALAGLKLAPDNKALLKARAVAALRSGDPPGAFEAAERLLELDPRSADGLAYRAGALGLSGDKDGMLDGLRRAAALDSRYQASLQSALRMPEDSDLLFLFPGEDAAVVKTARAAGAASNRKFRFGLLAAASLAGGLLIGFGLLPSMVGAMTTKARAVFARMTGRSPAVAAMRQEDQDRVPRPTLRGQYKLKRQIGAGGMGLVFEGEDTSLGRRVAIKKMRDELRLDRRERQRFVSEAKLVAALHHANIVDIYAIAEEGDDVYLVFEYVTGKTLHELIGAKGALSYSEAMGVFRGMAAALDFAHSRDIIHRDLKPSNIMVDEDGCVKVMDFGIARLAKDAATRYSMTNTIVGTPPYMAPEQEQGVVRKESDVYALGVCLYEMLCGKMPFVGLGGGLLMNKVNMNYVPVSRVTPGLPEGIDDVLARALQADPDKRFKSAKEMFLALNDLVPSGRSDLASYES
jgi:serine/threonine-protein kinase